MIASNYRKFPEAMALQMVLVFGALVWHTSRPTTTKTRAIRAERGRIAKAHAQIVQWTKTPTPHWWKKAKTAAVALAKHVKASIECLVWDKEQEAADDEKTRMLIADQVHQLIEDFLDTHHGNQQRPIKWAMLTANMTWCHVPSGISFWNAEKHLKYRG